VTNSCLGLWLCDTLTTALRAYITVCCCQCCLLMLSVFLSSLTYALSLFVSDSHGYSQAEFDQMSLRTWVNVVCGKMTSIDRSTVLLMIQHDGDSCSIHLYCPAAVTGMMPQLNNRINSCLQSY